MTAHTPPRSPTPYLTHTSPRTGYQTHVNPPISAPNSNVAHRKQAPTIPPAHLTAPIMCMSPWGSTVCPCPCCGNNLYLAHPLPGMGGKAGAGDATPISRRAHVDRPHHGCGIREMHSRKSLLRKSLARSGRRMMRELSHVAFYPWLELRCFEPEFRLLVRSLGSAP